MQFFFLKEEQCASSLAVVTVLKWEGIHRILVPVTRIMYFTLDSIKQTNERTKTPYILGVGAEPRSHFVLWSPQSAQLVPVLHGYCLTSLVMSATCA